MPDPVPAPPILSQHLLLSVAEELKLPLLQISQTAEAGRLHNRADLDGIQTSADTALQLIDNYVLGVRLSCDPQQLATEAVSVSSVLYDTGQQLHNLARSYGVTLELNIGGRYGPVTAHREGLQAALVSLGAALVAALPAQSQSQQLRLQLATHRSRYGIVAGIYGDTKFSAHALRRGLQLQQTSRQPLLNLSHTSAAGIFVADSILHAMRLRLSSSRHNGLYGLAAVLPSNHQLQLV